MMEKFKFTALVIITLAVVIILGYWAIITIKPANLVVERQKQAELQQQNNDLRKQVADLTDQLQTFKDTQTSAPVNASPSANTATALKYQILINDLQKLIDNNIFMKNGSQGTRVGTVQTFLNLYNNTSKAIDNDYGPGTIKDIINFQKAFGITADGQSGPGTFKKMIDWLKKQ